MEKLSTTLIISSLLHDIGKICYRADKSVGNHSKAGKDFLDQVLPNGYPEKKIILDSVYNHHYSILQNSKLDDDHIAYIVYEADNIAAGLDRRDIEGYEGAQATFDAYGQLESIFNILQPKDSIPQKYLIRALDKTNKINYPNSKNANQRATSANYQAILDDLKSNLKRAGSIGMSANELLKISEQLMSFIPSSTNTKEVCDISLYDHQRMTAAIATCMYKYFKANNIKDYKKYCLADKEHLFRKEQSFALVSGDISGIQDFIYTVPSKGALKNLRGRSFYLELLLEHVIDEILSELELSRANLIYSGGGHFYVLAPNTKQLHDVIVLAKEKINAWLLDKYGTSLYLALAYQECAANDFMVEEAQKSNKLGNLFRLLGSKIAQDKTNRYTTEQLKNVFDPTSSINKLKNAQRECACCKTSASKLELYTADTAVDVCPTCNMLYAIGHHILVGSKTIVASANRTKLGFIDSPIEVPCLKTDKYLYIVAENEAEAVSKKLDVERVYVINNLMVGSKMASHIWVGDYVAKDDDGSTQEFETLSQASCGIKRLGVMRADVDSLGAIFMSGFVQEKGTFQYCTLSRYATLSRQLSIFFKKYIVNICNKQLSGEDGTQIACGNIFQTPSDRQSKARNLNIVYSGGDDLFIIGAWDEVINFAIDLQSSFSRFTQDKLTFSAGIGLYESKFPVVQMARDTAKLESLAKENSSKDVEKNSIALFGVNNNSNHVYDWQSFKQNICADKLDFLLKAVKGNKEVLSTGFLYKLKHLLTDGDELNIARLAYSLARLEPKGHAKPEEKQIYTELRNKIYLWASNPKDKQELVTAIILLVYSERNNNHNKIGGQHDL